MGAGRDGKRKVQREQDAVPYTARLDPTPAARRSQPGQDAQVPEQPPEPLPKLLDCAGLQRELGVKRTAAEAIMRALPKQTIPGVRKVYVRVSDVRRLLGKTLRVLDVLPVDEPDSPYSGFLMVEGEAS